MGNASSGGLAFVQGGTGGGGGPSLTIGGNTAGGGAIVSSGTLFLAGGNNITLSQNGQSISINGGAGGAGFSAGVSGGNTAGSTGLTGTQLVLAGGSNITLSQSTGANGATVSIIGNVQTGVGISAAGQSASSGVLTLSNSNNVSFGMAASVVTASASFAQSNQNLSLFALGNTTQNSSTVLGAQSLSFNGLGELTVGFSNGSIQINSPPSSIGVSTGGNTSGNTGIYAGQVIFAGVNNITLSVSSGALGAQTISISAPATSSISGTGAVSVAVNGSTISIGVPVVPQNSFFNALTGDVTTLTQIGNGSVQVYPINAPKAFSASRADMMIFNSISSSSNSSHAGVISVFAGLYTLNGSTLSLASSGSQSYQWTNTSNNSQGSISGQRRLSLPINVNYTGGDIWMAVMSQTSSTNANWFTASNLVIQPQLTGQLAGLIGQATNNTYQIQPGYGVFSATSAQMPASMALSAINGAGSSTLGNNVYMAPVQFANLTA
jgi:hypothetical protein